MLARLLDGDRSFEVGTRDYAFAAHDSRVGPDVCFVLAGHTHLERAVPRARGGMYYNSGTWMRILRIPPDALTSREAFEPLYQALAAGRIDALDADPRARAGAPHPGLDRDRRRRGERRAPPRPPRRVHGDAPVGSRARHPLHPPARSLILRAARRLAARPGPVARARARDRRDPRRPSPPSRRAPAPSSPPSPPPAAAALSAAYVVVYLRGGPRIIDATSYWLEARSLAHGLLSFPLRAPETSVLGRFLLRSEHVDGPRAAVIFPPGYPAVLAIGFLAHAPLAVGPVLAAGLVIVTLDLARHLGDGLALPGGAPSLPKLAALFSVACAALRYHTADTMSHGLAALCFAAALCLAFHASDAARGRAAIAARGAPRGPPASPPGGSSPRARRAPSPSRRPSPSRSRRSAALGPLAPFLTLGAIPGVLLFLAHQHAATGVWGASSQRLYYEVSDGPPGCFRYGFGAGVGCLHEHGDFVRARLADGFGFLAAAGTTLRRLKMHLVDPANAEPLALLVPLGAWIARKSAPARVLALAVAAQIAAYVPFYFDGNYPGREAAGSTPTVLPIEHVLAAAAVVVLAARRPAPERWAAGALALALAGFAFRAGFDHAQLRDRDGGRPLFEPAELARAGVVHGLVLFDTDHGFDLAFDPAGGEGHGGPLPRRRRRPHGVGSSRGCPLRSATASPSRRTEVPPRSLSSPSSSPRPPAPRSSRASRSGPRSRRRAALRSAGVGRAHLRIGRALARAAPRERHRSRRGHAPPPHGRGPHRRAEGRGRSGRDRELFADGALVRRWAVAFDAGCRSLEAARVPPSAARVTLTLRSPGRLAAGSAQACPRRRDDRRMMGRGAIGDGGSRWRVAPGEALCGPPGAGDRSVHEEGDDLAPLAGHVLHREPDLEARGGQRREAADHRVRDVGALHLGPRRAPVGAVAPDRQKARVPLRAAFATAETVPEALPCVIARAALSCFAACLGENPAAWMMAALSPGFAAAIDSTHAASSFRSLRSSAALVFRSSAAPLVLAIAGVWAAATACRAAPMVASDGVGAFGAPNHCALLGLPTPATMASHWVMRPAADLASLGTTSEDCVVMTFSYLSRGARRGDRPEPFGPAVASCACP